MPLVHWLGAWDRCRGFLPKPPARRRLRPAILPVAGRVESLEARLLLSAVQFGQAVYRIAEGTRSFEITLSRDDASDADAVTIVNAGGTATGGGSDYSSAAFPVEVTFQPGESTATASVTLVSPKGDQVLESVETIELGLASEDPDVTFGAQQTATVEIHDAELRIVGPSMYLPEDGGPQTFTVVLRMVEGLTLQEDAVFDVRIDNSVGWIAVVFPDGIRRSHVHPDDYVLNTTRIEFAAGSAVGATQTITLTPLVDDVAEGIEAFYIQLDQVVGTPFAHVYSPGQAIVDVPVERINNPPPFTVVDPADSTSASHGRTDNDQDVTTWFSSASVDSVTAEAALADVEMSSPDLQPTVFSGSGLSVRAAAVHSAAFDWKIRPLEAPARMDLLAEFLYEPAETLDDEPGDSNSASIQAIRSPAEDDARRSSGAERLDALFADPSWLDDLTLLAPVV